MTKPAFRLIEVTIDDKVCRITRQRIERIIRAGYDEPWNSIYHVESSNMFGHCEYHNFNTLDDMLSSEAYCTEFAIAIAVKDNFGKRCDFRCNIHNDDFTDMRVQIIDRFGDTIIDASNVSIKTNVVRYK